MTRRVLIVGYGAFGVLHARAWSRLPGIALRVAEEDAAARERAVGDGLSQDDVFGDLELAMRDADVVDIVAPPDAHAMVAEMALSRGLPVLIEKPATRTLEEARRLAALARGVPVQVGMILRSHPLTDRARVLIDQGAIGRLVSMNGDFSGWKRMREDSSLIENDGVHFLDLMRHLAKARIVAVDAVANARLGGDVVDDIRIDMQHENGVAGELRLGLLRGGTVADSVVPGARTRKDLMLCGDKGILHLDFNASRLTRARVRYTESPGGWHPDPGECVIEDIDGATTVDLLKSAFAGFLETIDQGAPPCCGLEEGAIELAQVSEAIEAALGRGPRSYVTIEAEMEAAR